MIQNVSVGPVQDCQPAFPPRQMLDVKFINNIPDKNNNHNNHNIKNYTPIVTIAMIATSVAIVSQQLRQLHQY